MKSLISHRYLILFRQRKSKVSHPRQSRSEVKFTSVLQYESYLSPFNRDIFWLSESKFSDAVSLYFFIGLLISNFCCSIWNTVNLSQVTWPDQYFRLRVSSFHIPTTVSVHETANFIFANFIFALNPYWWIKFSISESH